MSDYLGWHFLREDGRLRYGDKREVAVGQTLTVDGPLVLCKVGLHASARALDALKYAPGSVACRVRLSGEVLAPEGVDKACATERTVLAMADVSEALRLFVIDTLAYRQRHIASLLARAGLEAHADAVTALSITADSLAESQRVFAAAWAAAWDAAWDAAGAAAWAAAGAAARAATWAAAWDAAWDAAFAAAWAAAGAAARAAAGAAARAAVGDAARAAARAAARDVLNERLEARLMAAVGLAV